MPRTSLKTLVCLVLLLITSSAFSQEKARWPTTFHLRDTVQHSGYIFAGRVLSIKFDPPQAANEVASLQITFRVEQGLRGTRTGGTLTIREWAGLWQGGARYRVGERVVLFLHPPSKLGLTSPVGGNHGRYPIDSKGNIVLDSPTARGGGVQARPRVSLREFVHAIRQAQVEE